MKIQKKKKNKKKMKMKKIKNVICKIDDKELSKIQMGSFMNQCRTTYNFVIANVQNNFFIFYFNATYF